MSILLLGAGLGATQTRLLDYAPGAAAAYSLRQVGRQYNGPVVRVRRESDSTERDFTASQIDNGTLALWVNATPDLPLDQSSGAAAAYSLRNLSSSYTGNVIRARRASDNDERDFTADEIIDGTLTTWTNASVDLPLDEASGAAAAYSLRNLSASYSGDVVRVRRAVDDAEQDFTAAEIDSGALAAFCSSGTLSNSLSNWNNVPNTTITSPLRFEWTVAPTGVQFRTINGAQYRVRLSGQASAAWGLYDWFQQPLASGSAGSFSVDLTYTALGTNNTLYMRIPSGGPGYIDFTEISIELVACDGFVKQWYDQSGNDNHATQTTAGYQPKIVSSGVVILEEGKPAILFDGGDDTLDATFPSFAAFTAAIVCTNNADNTEEDRQDALRGPSSSFIMASFVTDNQYRFRSESTNIDYYTVDKVQHIHFATNDGVTSSVRVDGGAESTGSDTAPAAGGYQIGGNAPGGYGWSGTLQEVVVWPSDLTSQRTAIEANLAEFYGIDLPSGVDTSNNEVDAFVTTWYDQSGNGNHATQTTATYQPKIVSDGALVTENGKAAVQFDGTDDYLTFASTITVSRYTNIAVYANDAIKISATIGLDNGQSLGMWSDQRIYENNGVSGQYVSTAYPFDEDMHIVSVTKSGDTLADFACHKDGVLLAAYTGNAFVSISLKYIGARLSPASYYDGTISELLIYPTDQTAQREGIETNTALYYGIHTSLAYDVQSNEVDGYVSTWYDQSGNGNDATQATRDNQPQIVSDGALITENDKVALQFDGVNDFLSNSSMPAIGTDNCSTFLLFRFFSSTGYRTPLQLGNTSTAFRSLLYASDGAEDDGSLVVGRLGGNFIDTTTSTNFDATLLTGIRTDPNIFNLFFHGAPTTPSSGNPSGMDIIDGLVIGSLAGTGQFLDGTMSEVCVYPSDKTAQRQRAEGNIAWTYGLQDKLPWNHPYAISFPGSGTSQTVPTDPDAIAYLTAVSEADGAGVEVPVANAINNFIVGCKADGIWDDIKASCILAGARSLAGALVPLVGAAPTNLPVANGFVSDDYDRATGLKGDGTSYLQTGFENTALTQNNAHCAVYATEHETGTGSYMGAFDSSTGDCQLTGYNATNTVCRFMAANGELIPTNYSEPFLGASRTDSATYVFRDDGSSNTISRISGEPTDIEWCVFERSTNATYTSRGTARIAFYSIGSSLGSDPATGLAALDTRVSNLIAAIGLYLDYGLNPDNYDQDTINYIYNAYKAGGSLA